MTSVLSSQVEYGSYADVWGKKTKRTPDVLLTFLFQLRLL